jgi:hypothetical protein
MRVGPADLRSIIPSAVKTLLARNEVHVWPLRPLVAVALLNTRVDKGMKVDHLAAAKARICKLLALVICLEMFFMCPALIRFACVLDSKHSVYTSHDLGPKTFTAKPPNKN